MAKYVHVRREKRTFEIRGKFHVKKMTRQTGKDKINQRK